MGSPVGLAEIAPRENQGDRFGEQSPGDERQRLLGGMIEPLGVVDHADERSLLGGVGQQTQHRQPDEEAIRRVAGAQPERRAQRVALRVGKRVEPFEEWRAQLMQSRERDLHLGLDAAGAHDAASRRTLDDVLQKGRLPDAGLPVQHEGAALAAPRRVQQPVERVAFASAAEQTSLRRGRCGCDVPTAAAEAPQLAARADVELGEHLVQVVLDGARADEQLAADLRIGEAVAGEPRDLRLLRR